MGRTRFEQIIRIFKSKVTEALIYVNKNDLGWNVTMQSGLSEQKVTRQFLMLSGFFALFSR